MGDEEEEEGEEEEGVCKMSVEIHTRKKQQQLDQSSRKRKSKALRLSLASLPGAAVAKAAVSLRRVKVSRDSGAHLALFMLKVGALELFRRGVQTRFPPLWWLVQAIPLLKAPPLLWLQRWSPFRSVIQGTQVFSKPVVFLSIATALSNAVDQRKPEDDPNSVSGSPSSSEAPGSQSPTPAPAIQEQNRETSQMRALKNDLEERGILLPDRISNDDLQRFYVASNGSTDRFVALVKKNVRWRQNYRFLTSRELEEWSQLVYWHHRDYKGRPLLIVRLGLASSTLVAAQRPRFIQAIVSQIESGVLNLLTGEDPRMTVVLDCAGAPSVGFPLHMTKSCCVLVQENYPTRLAALFIVNVPPFVRVVANAIVQILKPATRDKIFVESDNSAKLLADHLGGLDWVPIYLGGNCKCSLCNEARAALDECSSGSHHRVEELEEDDQEQQQRQLLGGDLQADLTPYQSCTGVLRVAIVGLLMLWVVVALIAGLYDPHLNQLPT